ncbi:MAG: SDR family oxidoreductase [Pseudomonadota bacterium]
MTTAIIGGTSGIGLETARQLQSSGQDVAVFGRSDKKLANAFETLGGNVPSAAVDAGDYAALRAALSAVPSLDAIIVSVGAGAGNGTLDSLGVDGLQAGFAAKVWPVWNAIQCAKDLLPPEGALTIIGAARAHYAAADAVGAAAVHGSLAAMIPSLAVALAPIRVNLVAPGITDTPPWNGFGDKKAAVFASFAEKTLLGRVGQPAEVAHAIVALTTNGYATGQVIRIDGGLGLSAG